MKPSKLYEALHALIGERVPLHIWGACGVGKSQIVAQVADDLDFDFIDVRAVQLDPVDLRGLPRIAADQTEWVPPKFLPTTGKGILFLDELTSAPQMTQAGCYQLVLDRKLGEYVLPDEWVVIAAGNPASERGVHFAMPRPLRNRFVHLELEADLNDWCKWAVGAGVRPEIIAFLRFKPDLLHTADATSDANAWPTPRSWEMASNVLRGIARRQKTTFLSGASEFEAQLLDGTVGPAAASELIAFLRLIEQVRPELNGLFREEDYPSAEKLRKKFGVKLEILPIPSGNDFRVQMSAEEQTRVSREIDSNVRQSLTRGTEDLWKRLREVVSHMVDRLNEPETRFHATLVTNVLDLVELLPHLNVNGDAELDRFAELARQRLCNFSAQDLKKHDRLFVLAATDATEIVAEIDSVLRNREVGLPYETQESPSVDHILAHMSAYMEAPAAA